ncbi:uncharacterized protein LOC117180924 [Belonocnema kinseyi]|uniref:uncharacterized protein LOC117180924 n=1 Tax=Belonocnema kinseyi TaxID=2817044 RepID=UPI00143D3DEC|nr:uncharacterized protein LOC117180924 [Belonocnema kinseyi]
MTQKTSITLLMDKQSLRKYAINIMKKFLARDLAMKSTAMKKVPGKELFKDYDMYTCIVDLLSEKFALSEEDVLTHIGVVFANSKDWDGGRKSRTRKSNESNDF